MRGKRLLKRLTAVALAAVMTVSIALCTSVTAEAGYSVRYTRSAEIYDLVCKGYNGGSRGPVTITWGRFYTGWYWVDAYLVTLSGTETVNNQSTGYLTDALAGFNLNNAYKSNVVNIINWNIPRNANIILAGHSLGGMIAQQVAADDSIKRNFNVMNTVCFGSPLLAAGQREGDVKRLGDTSDVIPYASGSTINNTAWAIAGLNRENGGYGTNLLAAHTQSYGRRDVWRDYDIVGQKWGNHEIWLDVTSTRYFKSPTNVKW